MNYRDFIQQVGNITGKLSASELRQVLFNMAENVSVHKRSDFLNQLTIQAGKAPKKGKKLQETLTKRVDVLVERIEDGYFCTGWGWDDALHDERDYGDESWADEMDKLLADCRKLVLQKEYLLAEELYGKLLGALDDGHEPGHLPGDPDPAMMLKESVDEHLSLYLAATYLNTVKEDRPRTINERIERFQYLGYGFGAEQISGCIPGQLPDFDHFLSDWLEYLVNQETGHNQEKIRNILSLQDITLLAAFARKNYRQYPFAWLDWVDRYLDNKNGNDALNVLQEGLSLTDLDHETRAQLADRLAELAVYLNRSELLIEGLLKAYESSPSLVRLIRWLHHWRQNSSEYGEFVQMIREKTSQRKRNDLLFHACLLTGDVEGARQLTALDEASDLAALSAFRYEQRKFFLLHQLYAISRSSERYLTRHKNERKQKRTISTIGERHREVETSGLAEELWLSGVDSLIRESSHRYLDVDTEKIVRQMNVDYQSYLEQIDQALQENPLNADQIDRSLSWCRTEIDRRVSAIVDNKHRSRYQEVARLVAALSEAMENQHLTSQAKGLIDFYDNKYRRFSAFRAELRQAVGMKA